MQIFKKIKATILGWKFLEPLIYILVKGKSTHHFITKILPPISLYKPQDTRICTRNGIQYKLHLSDYMEYINYYGLTDENKSNLYQLVKPGMFIFDVGANYGESALNLAARTGIHGKVYAFEPVPFLFERLQFNLSLNSYGNINPIMKALSNDNATFSFIKAADHNSGSTYLSQSEGENEIEAIPMDAFTSQQSFGRIDLIKIDVEGFEVNVLKGAKNTIIKHKPLLFIEVNDHNLKRSGSSAHELVNLLKEYHYQIEDAQSSEAIISSTSLLNRHLDIICRPIL